MTPFITFFTPHFRRPRYLAACLASVAAQTAVREIEHLVWVDHVGRGVGGMFTQVPFYREAVHGEYVHLLADDDVLASPTVVATVRDFARAHDMSPLIIVRVDKEGQELPIGTPWPPQLSHIDLGCLIARRDVWQAHCEAYGGVYEGDYHFARAVCDAGHTAAFCNVLFLEGAVLKGAAELPPPPHIDVGADVRGGGAT